MYHLKLPTCRTIPSYPLELPLRVLQITLADDKGLEPAAVPHPGGTLLIAVHQILDRSRQLGMDIAGLIVQGGPEAADENIG